MGILSEDYSITEHFNSHGTLHFSMPMSLCSLSLCSRTYSALYHPHQPAIPQSVVQGSVPHLQQPLTAVTMPEGGIADRNQRHLWTTWNHIQFCSQLAHRTCRDFHLHTPLRNSGRVRQWTLYFCFAHWNPSLIPRPKQPQCGLLSVPHAGKEGLSACIANRCLRLI